MLQNSIPKTIHYCWFGRNMKSGLINECINSWKEILPEYKIIEWNEDNFDIHCNSYVKEAYDCKMWAFVSDYVRLWALFNYGGLYFDTDVQVLKSFDCFLRDEAFSGYEVNDSPITAVMGSKPNNQMIGMMLSYYENKHFKNTDGSLNIITNTNIISNQLIQLGMKPNGRKQTINGFTVYPQIYFCPNNFTRIWNIPSKKSYAIHHFDQSWRAETANHTSLKGRVKRYCVGIMRNVIGSDRFGKLAKAIK